MFYVFFSVLLLTAVVEAGEMKFKHVTTVSSPCKEYSLINSVDFHPRENEFCATYTQDDRVILYKNNKLGLQVIQTLKNPEADLSSPQHAVFSPDGQCIVVANWTNRTFTVYPKEAKGSFSAQPKAVIPAPEKLSIYRFHGIAFSPCGQFLAVAYGAGSEYGRALAVFRFNKENYHLELLCCLRGRKELHGTPKGIAFSPDGNAILVTLSDLNSLEIFDFKKETGEISPYPRQIVQGSMTGISRPEDVKLSPSGKLCALSNSDAGSVSFFSYDSSTNTVTSQKPVYTLNEGLVFPHGLAFSRDGTLFAITQFGSILSDSNGDIFLEGVQPQEAKIALYTITK